MKILSLSSVPLLPYLGSGKTRLMWTKGLSDAGHEVKILQPEDYTFWPSQNKALKLRMAFGVFLSARKLIKTEHFDLVEFYGDQYWMLLLWSKIFRVKNRPLFVAHVDGIELHDMDKEQLFWMKRKGLKKWMYKNTHYRTSKLTFKLADRYVCGCKDDLTYVFQKNIFKPEHAFCIPPGIDDSYHSIPFQEKKKPYIIFLGSWIERKGIRVVSMVMSEILKENKDYEFHIYGSWSLKESILLSFPQSLRKQVIVFDKLPLQDLTKGILQSSILFFPSYSEGFGLATVEAMSCSCAVITTRTGVGSELSNGNNAMLCDFNDETAMKNALHVLINDEFLRKKIAYNGYLKAKSFRWSKQVELLSKVYSNWLNKPISKSKLPNSLSYQTLNA